MSNSQKLLEYYWKRWGKKTGDITYLNTLAVISQIIKRPFPVLVVAPSQQGKSTPLIEDIQPNWEDHIKWLGSDFTINSLCHMSSQGLLKDKTWIINDMTLLLSSKSDRGQQRLINGLAEVLSEGYYEYSDRMSQRMKNKECIDVGKGGCNMILCITQRSFQKNEEKLIENTFGNRLLKLYYSLNMNEQKELYLSIEDRKNITYPKLDIIKTTKPKVSRDMRQKILELSQTIYIHQMSSSLIKQAQIIERVVCAKACIDGHDEVLEEDIQLIDEVMSNYVKDIDNVKKRLFDLWLTGEKYYNISNIIDRNVRWIEDQIKEFKQAGIINEELMIQRNSNKIKNNGYLESD